MAQPPVPVVHPPTHGIRAWMLAVSLSAALPMLAMLAGVTVWLQHQQGVQREASLQRQALRAADAVAAVLGTQQARIATVALGVAAREQRLDVLHQVLRAVAAGDRPARARHRSGRGLAPDEGFHLRSVGGGTGRAGARPCRAHGGRAASGAEPEPARPPAHAPGHAARLGGGRGRPTGGDRGAQPAARAVSGAACRGLPDRAAQAPPGEVQHGQTQDGGRVLAVVAPVGRTGWHLAVGVPEDEVDRAEHQVLLAVMGIGLLVVLIGIAGSLWLSQRLARQVSRVATGHGPPGADIRELQHIGERIDAADAALADAMVDALTGLPARRAFTDAATAALAQLAGDQRLGRGGAGRCAGAVDRRRRSRHAAHQVEATAREPALSH